MTKYLAVLFGIVVIIHTIKPINLPGLRTRRDAWKIAAFALAVMIVVTGIRPS
ncbi:MAG: hypothetical protein AAF638_00890 [Pseudomonadota bacterium]